jgi:vacuolar-type H+-ATPase subunit F/Vma7
MKEPLSVLCGREVASGFRLAGLSVIAVDGGAEAEEVVRLHIERGHGVLLVSGDLYRSLPENLHRRADRRGKPILLPFPAPSELSTRSRQEEEVLEILRRAVGYRVRLR